MHEFNLEINPLHSMHIAYDYMRKLIQYNNLS